MVVVRVHCFYCSDLRLAKLLTQGKELIFKSFFFMLFSVVPSRATGTAPSQPLQLCV